MTDRKVLEGEVMDDAAGTPPVHDVTPGWIGRNRVVFERGRNVSRALMVVAPPPARLALAAVSVAADAALLADDMRRRAAGREEGTVKAGALILEGAALLAMSRFAPARLAANLGAIEGARKVLDRLAARA